MWLVPTYANPTGDTTSQEIAERLASMPTAAPDFKIFWDNAYALHHLTAAETKTADVVSLATAAGNPHRPIVFASTSKVTYAGAGVASSAARTRRRLVRWPPRPRRDRPRQGQPPAARGVLRLRRSGVREHMAKHRELLAPQVRGRRGRAHRPARRARRGDLDPARRRLLRQPRRAPRHRDPGDRAGQGRRRRTDPGRFGVPRQPRPGGHQHPAGAVLPPVGGGRGAMEGSPRA